MKEGRQGEERKVQERRVGKDLLSLLGFLLHSVPQERRSQRLKLKFILFQKLRERGDSVLREDFCPSVCL